MSEKRGAQYWRQQIEAQRGSGLSVAGYCRIHGMAAWGFYHWRRRLQPQTEAMRLIPVTICDDQGASGVADAGIQVRLASGIVLGLSKDFDGPALQRAVTALR